MKNYRARKGYGKRRKYSFAERRSYWIGVGAGANVDQIVSKMGAMSKPELQSFENGHEFWKGKNRSTKGGLR